MMAEAKFRIETANGAVEFAGSENFVGSQLDKLESYLSMFGARTSSRSAEMATQTLDEDLSTNTIAAILGADSGPDLIMAAAARLTLIDGEERLSRTRITEEMKAATSFYKATYLNNLSAYLDRLSKSDRLRVVAPSTYALSARERQSIESKLAQSE